MNLYPDKIVDRGVKLFDTLVLGALVFGGYTWYDTWQKKQDKANALDQMATGDPSVLLAKQLRIALFGGEGFVWTKVSKWTDAEKVIQLGSQVSDFAAVVKAYASLYDGDNLNQHLSDELNATEYQQFFANVRLARGSTGSSGGSVPTAPKPAAKKYNAVANKATVGYVVKNKIISKSGNAFKKGEIIGRIVGNPVQSKGLNAQIVLVEIVVKNGYATPVKTTKKVYVKRTDIFYKAI